MKTNKILGMTLVLLALFVFGSPVVVSAGQHVIIETVPSGDVMAEAENPLYSIQGLDRIDGESGEVISQGFKVQLLSGLKNEAMDASFLRENIIHDSLLYCQYNKKFFVLDKIDETSLGNAIDYEIKWNEAEDFFTVFAKIDGEISEFSTLRCNENYSLRYAPPYVIMVVFKPENFRGDNKLFASDVEDFYVCQGNSYSNNPVMGIAGVLYLHTECYLGKWGFDPIEGDLKTEQIQDREIKIKMV